MSKRRKYKSKKLTQIIDPKLAWAWIAIVVLIVMGFLLTEYMPNLNPEIRTTASGGTVQCAQSEFIGGNESPCGYNVWEYDWSCVGTVCIGTPIENAQEPASCESSDGGSVCTFRGDNGTYCLPCCSRGGTVIGGAEACSSGYKPGWRCPSTYMCYGPPITNDTETDPDPTDVDGGEQCEDGFREINNQCVRACYRHEFYDLSSSCSEDQFNYDWSCLGAICFGTPRSTSLNGGAFCPNGQINWEDGCVGRTTQDGRRAQKYGRLCFAVGEECEISNQDGVCSTYRQYCK